MDTKLFSWTELECPTMNITRRSSASCGCLRQRPFHERATVFQTRSVRAHLRSNVLDPLSDSKTSADPGTFRDNVYPSHKQDDERFSRNNAATKPMELTRSSHTHVKTSVMSPETAVKSTGTRKGTDGLPTDALLRTALSVLNKTSHNDSSPHSSRDCAPLETLLPVLSAHFESLQCDQHPSRKRQKT